VQEKSKILIVSALALCAAIFAVPRIADTVAPSESTDSGEPESVTESSKASDPYALDDAGTSGSEFVPAPSGDSGGTKSRPSTAGGLSAQLASALERLQQVRSVDRLAQRVAPMDDDTVREVPSAEVPAPQVETAPETSATAPAPSTPVEAQMVVPAGPPDPRVESRRRLAAWLARNPLNGAVMAASGSTLFHERGRVAEGAPIGCGDWVLERVESTTVILRSGSMSVRVELPERRSRTSSAFEPRVSTTPSDEN
jgi:hypothetical protein